MTVLHGFREECGSNGSGNVGVGADIVGLCNLHCVQCYNCGPPTEKIMPFATVRKIIDAASRNFSEFYVLGGEPTLHPELPEILKLACAKMKKVYLVTNGLALANAEYCRSLCCGKNLTISMHRRAIRPEAEELVDQLSGRKGAFRDNAAAWENIAQHWLGKICAQINLLRPLVELGHAFDVFSWARKNHFEPVMEMVKEGTNFYRGNNLDLAPEEIISFYNRLREFDLRFFPEKCPQQIVPPVYGNPCTLMETSLHVNVAGEVVLCVGNASISYGSVNENGIDQALSSPLRQAIRNYREWIVGPCRICAHFDHCHGGCRGNAKSETGCPRASDPYCWRHSKNLKMRDMVPETCRGCLLENHPGCAIKV
jgi:radical SAM protein with 4Fe4S-binding SPASM domain